MKANAAHSDVALEALARVYRHRRDRVRRELVRAAAEVAASEAELVERRAAVAELEGRIHAARRAMAEPEAARDPRAIERSLRYVEAVRDELERRVWYVELTVEELDAKRAEHARRRRELAAAEARIDAIVDRAADARRRRARRRETRAANALDDAAPVGG